MVVIKEKIYTNYEEFVKEKNYIDNWEGLQNKMDNFYYLNESHKKSVIDTCSYLWDNIRNFFLIEIKNTKIQNFLFVENLNQKYNWLKKIPVSLRLKNSKLLKINRDRNKWIPLDGIVNINNTNKTYSDFYIPHYYAELEYLFSQISDNLEDNIIIINKMDMCVLHKDGLLPYTNLICMKHKYKNKIKNFIPIYSFNQSNKYLDIAIPTPDDITRIFNMKVCIGDICTTNNYVDLYNDWDNRIDKAIFRGSFTGTSSLIKYNPRLKVSSLSLQYPDILDAGLTNFKSKNRIRKIYLEDELDIIDINYEKQFKKEPLSFDEQIKYKYHIYIEGNVGAYRGSYIFSLGSVILWVKSYKYQLWFENLLKDYENCIFIENDLSNLITVINWLKNNDDKAKIIAQNGMKFYKENFNKKEILNTFINKFNKNVKKK